MGWIKEEPITGGHGGCLNCGYQYEILPMDKIIAVGSGCATVTKNGKDVYSEPQGMEDVEDKLWTLQHAENEVIKDPDNDWRIHLVAPLSERHYQRQSDNTWVLYEKGMGFA